MKLGKTILVLAVVWLAIITASHGVLNLRWLVKKAAGGPDMQFGVGFLPVTCHLTCPVTDFINRNIVQPVIVNGLKARVIQIESPGEWVGSGLQPCGISRRLFPGPLALHPPD